ncbi:hypothetical protein Cantr_06015 [Candida viswanathii]|uniref:Something about silencing protein 4 domain-containing protein n=1 Tax=Candida viswanathii TaxID=5486 RepID=A0A367XQN6_9ASCO|nr:hypothetical protein Cantr_06015 [Candida viswanathii]
MAVMEPHRHRRRRHQQEEEATSTNGNGESSSRKLRSTTAKPKASDAVLFDFDNVNEYLHNNKPIVISTTNRKAGQSPYNHYGHNTSQLPKLPVRTGVSQTSRALPRKSAKTDPLPDSLYEIFHRKMRRNEKQMTNEERIKNLWELDTLQSHLEDLNQLHWFRALPAITSIKDVKDYDELERKRDLTISEIERLLRKHDIWRKRQELFNNDVKSYINYGNDESDPEYDIPIDQLRNHRQWERRQRYGPIVKLNLNGKYCLVIDPLAPPKIIEVEQEDAPCRSLRRDTQIERGEDVDTTKEEEADDDEVDDYDDIEEVYEHIGTPKRKRPRYNGRVRLEDVDDVSGIDFETGESRFFGTEFVDLPTYKNGYQLPISLKNWINRR